MILIFLKMISEFQRATTDSPRLRPVSRTWAVEATTATFVMLSNARARVRFPGKEKFPILLFLPLPSTRSLTHSGNLYKTLPRLCGIR